MAKRPKKDRREKPNRPASPEVIARGCKACGRWALFARAVYQESGEICKPETCPNVIEVSEVQELWRCDAFDLYEESAALKEKSED